MKKCITCKIEKDNLSFNVDKRAKDKLESSCKECLKEYRKAYRSNPINKIRKAEYMSKYRKGDVYKEYYKKYRCKMRSDPRKVLDNNLSRQLWRAISGIQMGIKWEDTFGYSTNDLRKHLEKQFDENMTWDNYGSYWCVDHILPKNHFKYISIGDEEFKKCWALSNLRPLEAKENMSKGSKITFEQENGVR